MLWYPVCRLLKRESFMYWGQMMVMNAPQLKCLLLKRKVGRYIKKMLVAQVGGLKWKVRSLRK